MSQHETVASGSEGAGVSQLQTMLTAQGFAPGPVDGVFGERTAAAVVAFQTANALEADGAVGPATWAALEAAAAAAATAAAAKAEADAAKAGADAAQAAAAKAAAEMQQSTSEGL